MSEETRRKISEATQKQWSKMTKEEKMKFLKPWIEAGKEGTRKWWAKMTKEERREYLKSRQEVGRKVSRKALLKKYAEITEEEKKKWLAPWLRAGQKAAQKANPSSIEKAIWNVLNDLNINYETQVSFYNHKFIVDIYIPAQRLIIECNGDYWHNYEIFPEREKRDKTLEKYAKNNDYNIVWLWESDIRKNPKLALVKGLKVKGLII